MSPIDWTECGPDLWLVLLRCSECGSSRLVVAEFARSSATTPISTLPRGRFTRFADALERERVHAEADEFIDLLRRGVINANDFDFHDEGNRHHWDGR